MKNKFYILVLVLSFLCLAPASYADNSITGTAYGDNIGLIHFDYVTAINPFAECSDIYGASPTTVNCPLHADYSSYHIGPREDFYLSPISPDLDIDNLYYDTAYTAQVSNAAECSPTHCFLEGFLWSDEIGWISLKGSVLQSILGSTDFPDGSFARVSSSDGIFSGFIWSEKTGWIKLASNGFDSSLPQTQANWGVWIDLTSPLESPLVSTECAVMNEADCKSAHHICNWGSGVCQPLSLQIGRKIEGNVWSEKLGWIKWNSESEFFSGVYTNWIPDTTPPVLHVDEENIWFANNSEIALLEWANFASDPESGIDMNETEFYITTLGSACATAINDTDGVPNNDTFQFIDPVTNRLEISLSTYGLVDIATPGYCKYSLEAKLTNGAGLTFYIDDPADTTIEVPGGYDTSDPEKYRGTPLTFFVRAGDPDSTSITSSDVTCIDPAQTAVADGDDCYEYHFNAEDNAGNPVVPVSIARDGTDISANPSSTWMRDAYSKFIFNSEIFFDQVLPPPSDPHFVPIRFDSDPNPQTQTTSEDIEYESLSQTSTKSYPAIINAFAPTNTSNTFDIDSSVLTVRDNEMPAISEFDVVTSAVLAYETLHEEQIPLTFTPAVTVTGLLDNDVLIPSVPVEASFTVLNNSDSVNIDKIAIDNRMYFENESGSDGFGKEVLDMRNIGALDGLTEDDPLYIGRTDPISNLTRYLVMTSDNVMNGNIFHTDEKNIHTEAYSFEFNAGLDSFIDTSGQYEVDGIYDLTKEEKEKLNDGTLIPPFTYDNFYIDRNDVFTTNPLDFGNNKIFSYSFTPNQFMSVPPSDNVLFNVDQYVAYDVSGIGKYTIYELPNVIDDISFKSIGLQATGQVTGENIYDTTGRDLDAISTVDASELKRQIRNNVADITRNMDLETCGAQTLTDTELPSSADPCVIVDDINKTIIAVYTDHITLENSVTVPAGYSYTLILKDGADLTIEGNILPGNSISFGIIALADENGDGANVYIYPEPTDIHALLYAEGSIISKNDSGDCYGAGDCELKNQLYWKGSIVSRNTIGGAPSATLPPRISADVDCPGIDAVTCAKKYDMDYLRRFTVRAYKNVSGDVIGHYSADGIKYSGGNSCNTDDPPVCTFTGDTTMTQTSSGSLIDLEASKSYDPVFVEKSNKPAPPGFSTSAGFSRSQVIR